MSRFSAVGSGESEPRLAEHSRAELELNLVLQGHAQILVGEQRVRLAPEHLLWIRPRESAPLRKRAARAQDVLLRKLTRLEARELSALFAGLPVGQGRDVFNAGLGYALARGCSGFCALRPRARSHARSACILPCARRRSSCATGTPSFRTRSWQLERFVHELGDGEAHTLTSLALDAGFGSYTQFHRVFRRVLGCSLAQFVKRRRLSLPGSTPLTASSQDRPRKLPAQPGM